MKTDHTLTTTIGLFVFKDDFLCLYCYLKTNQEYRKQFVCFFLFHFFLCFLKSRNWKEKFKFLIFSRCRFCFFYWEVFKGKRMAVFVTEVFWLHKLFSRYLYVMKETNIFYVTFIKWLWISHEFYLGWGFILFLGDHTCYGFRLCLATWAETQKCHFFFPQWNCVQICHNPCFRDLVKAASVTWIEVCHPCCKKNIKNLPIAATQTDYWILLLSLI